MTTKAAAAAALRPRLNKYIPHTPTAKQQAGLLLPHREVLYGGAAGGGKSDWLLMAALQYVDVPGYSALLLRRSFRELHLEGGLMERADAWLGDTDAHFNAARSTWEFPSGAVLTFGYLEKHRDHERYQGSNWLFVGFDELTQFTEKQYRYLFTRLRRPQLADDTPASKIREIEALQKVPVRMRAASNPGGVGHDWVKNRWAIYPPEHDPTGPLTCHQPGWVQKEGRVFLPAGLLDNPHLDEEDYRESLAELDPVTRAQMLQGDWAARESGGYFKPEWFPIVSERPKIRRAVRYWDLAATEESPSNLDPDWTAGCLLALDENGELIVLDVQRFRATPQGVETRIQQTAELDGRTTTIVIEQEPGSGGVNTISHYKRRVLPRYEVRGEKTSGSKIERARGVSSKSEARMIRLLAGPWIPDFLDELDAFPEGGHDDQVDAFAGAWNYLMDKSAAPGIGPDIWR